MAEIGDGIPGQWHSLDKGRGTGEVLIGTGQVRLEQPEQELRER